MIRDCNISCSLFFCYMRQLRYILCTLSLFYFGLGNAWCRHHKQQETLRDSLVEYSKEFIGCKYKYASKGPKTFDCSGFTGYIFNKFGYTLNSSSAAQYTQGDKVKVDDAQKGDLIFFKGSNASSKSVGHVGIITQTNEKRDTVWFIHASVQSGVTIDSYPGYAYYNTRFIGCRQIIGEENREETEGQSVVTEDTTHKEPKKDEVITPEKEEDSIHKTTQVTHIVVKGDNLYRLSKQYGCSVDNLIAWNKLQNSNLRIGQELIVNPAKATEKEAPAKEEKKDTIVVVPTDTIPTVVPDTLKREEIVKDETQESITPDKAEKEEAPFQPEEPQQRIHIVQKGETLYRISKQYGCTVDQIKQKNNLKNNNIKIGQELLIGE